MFIIYDLIYLISCLLYFPFLLLRGKWHKGLLMRMGFLPKEIKEALVHSDNIWIHAVSVGEVLSIKGLIQNLKEIFPHYQIVLSTSTKTGYEMAAKGSSGADVVFCAPLDFGFLVHRMLNLIKPKIYIVAETELWPNLLTCLNKRKISVVQVNGRISDSSFGRYKKIRFFFKKEINRVSAFCMQSLLDKARIIQLGASPEKVQVVGNIKFDDIPKEGEYSKKCFDMGKDKILLVGGSTHPGEEQFLLNIFKSILNEHPNLRLILAPRHVARIEEVCKVVAENGFDPIRFSNIKNKKVKEGHVIVVDTMGDLKSLYSMASIVFVGKSLTVGGGHNIIEPACFAKPILIGPLMENFRTITDVFLRDEAVIQVKDLYELSTKIKELLVHPEKRNEFGRRARNVVKENAGATKRTITVILKYLTGV